MQEVGTRDGLQAECAFVPTEEKIALVNSLSRAGLAKIEVTAFVSPKAVPALRDAEMVMRGIERVPSVVYSALVPNVRGAERAVESGADELNLVMSASESHNLAQPAHDTRAVLQRLARGCRHRSPSGGGRQHLAVLLVRLSDGR
jgi:hydroxymethylglutaryl-CoA lyase